MAYDVTRPLDLTRANEVRWDGDPQSERDRPTLAEMIEAAKKEFPGVPFEELMVTASGYDAEIIWLKRKK